MASSLADKLALLTNPEPVFADPEQEPDETAAKVVGAEEPEYSEYLEVGKSALRANNSVDLAAEARYAGKKVSRAGMARERGEQPEADLDFKEHAAAELGHMFELQGEEDEEELEAGDESADVENDDDSREEDDNAEEGNESEGEEEDWAVEDDTNSKNEFVFDEKNTDFSQFGDEDEDGEGESSDEDDADSTISDQSPQDDVEDAWASNLTAVADEVEKGRAVQRQLKVWDRLLETRIQQQKLLTRINKLPVNENWNRLTDGPVNTDFQIQISQTQKALRMVLNNLLELESVLDGGTADGEPPAKRRKRLEDFSSTLADTHQAFTPMRNQLIDKWNDKTRITAAGKNAFSSLETSTLLQIEQILCNRARLVARTQVKRSCYRVLGTSQEEAEEGQGDQVDVNVFDDDDFYHQLLRDLIDRKTNSSADQSQISRQWLEVQKLRTKLKKKVDTKASKGRKVRYDIHAKLVNFMAPVYSKAAAREETMNQLFSSLFGGKK